MEVYAALLLGFVAEGSAHQQKVRVWPCLLLSETQRWPSAMQTSAKPAVYLRAWLYLRVQPPCGAIKPIRNTILGLMFSQVEPVCTMRTEDTMQLRSPYGAQIPQ